MIEKMKFEIYTIKEKRLFALDVMDAFMKALHSLELIEIDWSKEDFGYDETSHRVYTFNTMKPSNAGIALIVALTSLKKCEAIYKFDVTKNLELAIKESCPKFSL